ncbi:MAG: hypothetical protein Q7R70_05675 [Candidatus Diapherotrites archaeon]|nr:hypothetical protein [Candidatus Diapherotrites archaeon]
MNRSLEELLKQTFTRLFSKKFVLSALVLFIISSLITFVFSALIAGVFSFAFLPDSSALLFLAAFLLVVAWSAIDTLIKGIGLFLAKDHCEGKAFSLSTAFKGAKARFKDAFLLEILFALIVIAFLALVFSPVILSGLHYFSDPVNASDFQYAIENIAAPEGMEMLGALMADLVSANALFIAIAVLICAIVALAFIPAILVLQQAVFFEKLSAIDALKKAIHYGFRNFFRNYAFALAFGIPVFIAYFIVTVIIEYIAPSQDIGFSLLAIAFIIQAIASLALYLLVLLFSANIYRLDFFSARPSSNAKKSK